MQKEINDKHNSKILLISISSTKQYLNATRIMIDGNNTTAIVFKGNNEKNRILKYFEI